MTLRKQSVDRSMTFKRRMLAGLYGSAHFATRCADGVSGTRNCHSGFDRRLHAGAHDTVRSTSDVINDTVMHA